LFLVILYIYATKYLCPNSKTSTTATTASEYVDMSDSDDKKYGSIAVPDAYDDDFDNDSDSETLLNQIL
jgi:hypothetical protein